MTSVAVALTDGYLQVLECIEEVANVQAGPEQLMEQVVGLVRRVCGTAEVLRDVRGIGVGLPSPVSFSEGKPIVPPLMPGWDGFPVRDRLANALGVPVTIDNDVNIMALGEAHGGAARDPHHFLFVKLGTGIGCGIVVDGELYRGHAGCAGDIGHIGVGDSSALCHCGRAGCLEAQFGGSALAQRAVVAAHSGESPLLASKLAEQGHLGALDVSWASASGDPASSRLIRSGGQLLGQVLAGLVNFFNPEMIVLGGGLAQLGPLLLAEIRSVVLDRSTPLATNELAVVMSTLADVAGVTGAALLATNTFIDSIEPTAPALRQTAISTVAS